MVLMLFVYFDLYNIILARNKLIGGICAVAVIIVVCVVVSGIIYR